MLEYLMGETLFLQNPWWENKPARKSVIRPELLSALKKRTGANRVCMLLGGRRVGKTTLMHQYIDDLINSGINPKYILYVLLDTRVFENASIIDLLRSYRQIHNLSLDDEVYLFLDEIQYKDGWEQEVKNLYDTDLNTRIILSGSASFKIHTKTSFLTGRYGILNIYPLSFSEWLRFKDIEVLPSEQYKYKTLLEEYLMKGGYPEYVLAEDPEYFPNLIDSIVYKDFVEYFNIKNLDLVKDLFGLLADRAGSHASLSKLGNVLGVTKETVREYVRALRGNFSIYELQRYATSRNERIYFPKKYYLNDNGLQFNLTGKLNKGQAAERTIYDHLRKVYGEDVYFYYENGREVDFVIKNREASLAIESKYINSIDEFESKNLILSLEDLDLDTVLVITDSLEMTLDIQNKRIEFKPLWKFLSGMETVNR